VTQLPSLASFEDMETRLGVDLDPESLSGRRAQAALDDASTLVRSIAGLSWISDNDSAPLDFVPSIVVTVTLACAIRAFKNPDATAQASVGDVSVSYGGASSGTPVYLTKEERRSIYRAVGKLSAGSVDLESDLLPRLSNDMLVEVEGGGDPLPLGPIPWEEP
jgi:hypothetical protein